MIFVLLLIPQLVLLISANPFHKYPFVFLLDVGNEELDKTNTEQIRISSPGGSLALRYPGIKYGDTIVHVRVSGIDFGTDLKANINDGGPGYNYVVLVFEGNPGVPYDAVITIQTVKDTGSNNIEGTAVTSERKSNEGSSNGGDSDENTSAEDTSDDSETLYAMKRGGELTQASSKVYNYIHNTAQHVQRDDNGDSAINNEGNEDLTKHSANGSEIEEEDLSETSEENSEESNAVNNESSNSNVESDEQNGDELSRNVENEETNGDEKSSDDIVTSNDYVEENINPTSNIDYAEYSSQDSSKNIGYEETRKDRSRNEKDLIYSNDNVREEGIPSDEIYDISQSDEDLQKNEDNLHRASSDDDYDDPAYSADPSEIDQMFNDEEVHSEPAKDPNNSNFYDIDSKNAVAY